mmetsp:Transcript_92143/g.298331  ORF Transcript_92143/g.298331 Transcript_92143/m.298331 type:complete len:314 (-) Transcript_92143:467-1408(-)
MESETVSKGPSSRNSCRFRDRSARLNAPTSSAVSAAATSTTEGLSRDTASKAVQALRASRARAHRATRLSKFGIQLGSRPRLAAAPRKPHSSRGGSSSTSASSSRRSDARRGPAAKAGVAACAKARSAATACPPPAAAGTPLAFSARVGCSTRARPPWRSPPGNGGVLRRPRRRLMERGPNQHISCGTGSSAASAPPLPRSLPSPPNTSSDTEGPSALSPPACGFAMGGRAPAPGLWSQPRRAVEDNHVALFRPCSGTSWMKVCRARSSFSCSANCRRRCNCAWRFARPVLIKACMVPSLTKRELSRSKPVSR